MARAAPSDDEDSNDAGPDLSASATTASGAAAKKKKRNKKKKKTGAGAASPGASGPFVLPVQTDPPSIPLSRFYASRADYPHGEECEYGGAQAFRTTSEEKRTIERLQHQDWIEDMRLGAEVHRQVRKHVQANIRVGMPLVEVALVRPFAASEHVRRVRRRFADGGAPCLFAWLAARSLLKTQPAC